MIPGKGRKKEWGRRVALWLGLCLFGCLYAPWAKELEGTFLRVMEQPAAVTDVMGEGAADSGPDARDGAAGLADARSSGSEVLGAESSDIESPAEKVAYLTFDDGPSTHSGELLDILKEENVKATFFVVGKEDEESREVYKRIVREGHSLGLHSYSHVYKQIYSSVESFQEDLWKLKTYLYHITGVSCDIYRFPGGSSTTKIKFPLEQGEKYLKEKGIRYFDWNATAEDAVCVQSAPGVIMNRVLKDALKHDKTVILMHDLNCCKTTLNAVRPLIARLRKEGYIFDRLTKDTILE